MENTRSRDPVGQTEKVCEPCDDCYSLVSQAANAHRANLAALDSLLQQIAENPEPVGKEFEFQLRQLQLTVTATLADARITSQNDERGGTLRDRLEDLRAKLRAVTELVVDSDRQMDVARGRSAEADRNVANFRGFIDRAREALKVPENGHAVLMISLKSGAP